MRALSFIVVLPKLRLEFEYMSPTPLDGPLRRFCC